MGPRTWPEDWEDRLGGADCPMCANQGLEDNGFGRRILKGRYADVFLQRKAPMPGYAIAIWKDGHVAEPMDLDRAAAAGYWQDLLDAARAIRSHYDPAKLNFETLGNAVPHLHTHVLPRYLDDVAPGKPLPWALVSGATAGSESQFETDVEALRRLVAPPGSARG